MRSFRRTAALVAGFTATLALPVTVVGDGPVPAPSAAASPAVRLLRYNPSTERVVKGTVEAVVDLPIPNSAVRELSVRTDASPVPVVVRLGKLRLLGTHNLEVAPGDAIEVTGSLVRDGDREVVLARLVTVRGRTVALRRPQGGFIRDPGDERVGRPAARPSAPPRQ